VITVGVDLAAADERSGLAVVEWSPGRAVISSVEVGVSDAQIVSTILASDKAGIDSPLGFGWGLAHRGYKRAGLASDLVSSLLAAAPWLSLGQFESLCRRSHDALDAVVAALAARAAATGRATRPTPAQLPTATVEGWIALPTCPLIDLVQPEA
jgi:predicted nuclease with RNAse H fold